MLTRVVADVLRDRCDIRPTGTSQIGRDYLVSESSVVIHLRGALLVLLYFLGDQGRQDGEDGE